MSQQQKLKAGAKKDAQKEWDRGRTSRLLDKLKKGKVPGVNPQYQAVFAEQIEGATRSPYSSEGEESADGGSASENTDIPLREYQPVGITSQEAVEFETPFGRAEHTVRLQTDEENVLGQGTVDLEAELNSDDPETRNKMRRTRNRRSNVPAHYDDTYVDVYGNDPVVHVPNPILRDDCESRLNSLFPTASAEEQQQQNEDAPPEEVYDTSLKDRETSKRSGNGFLHPYDAPCFLKMDPSLIRRLLEEEDWFRTAYHWLVPLANSHIMLPDESISLKNLLMQANANGTFYHAWLVYPAQSSSDAVEGGGGGPTATATPKSMGQARLSLKFNNDTAQQQADLAVQQQSEAMYQKASTISSYIRDFGCFTVHVTGVDPLPQTGQDPSASTTRVRLQIPFLDFM